MATFIRIKRRLCDEPLESIVVRPKRMRVEGGGAGGEAEEEGGGGGGVDLASPPPLPPPTLLERVGTVESKDAKIDASLLREYKKGWELRQTYKRLGGAEGGWREAGRKMAKERERESREMITNKHRGNITDTDKLAKTTTTEEEEEEEGNKKRKAKETEGKEGEEEEKKKKKEEGEEEAVVQFYDAKISFPSLPMGGLDEVITCNGRPMEMEKFVYDIYYYPRDTDWGNFVFEEPNLTMEVKGEGEEDDTDDDDENAEDNWRNDYPEDEDEDEDEYAEEYDYFDRPTRRRNFMDFNTDESFDADEYEENDEDDCGFDEDGNLITVASLGDRLKVTTLGSGDESD